MNQLLGEQPQQNLIESHQSGLGDTMINTAATGPGQPMVMQFFNSSKLAYLQNKPAQTS